VQMPRDGLAEASGRAREESCLAGKLHGARV
jgi:hypothetical protein